MRRDDHPRLAHYTEQGLTPPLVEVGGYGYLLNWLLDHEGGLGPVRGMGMGGLQPVDWSDITHFRLNLKLELEAWEAQILKAMSARYLSGLERGKNPLARSPIDLGNQ